MAVARGSLSASTASRLISSSKLFTSVSAARRASLNWLACSVRARRAWLTAARAITTKVAATTATSNTTPR
ncbi:MAG: hypothetical protein QM695_03515 [Micropruina sp.]